MIKIGVFGAGHLGRIHINLLNSSNKFKLVGFYDPDKNSINKLNEKNNCKYRSEEHTSELQSQD